MSDHSKENIKKDKKKLMLNGAEALVQALKDQGVKVIYGYPGGAVLHIYDALFKQNDIEHILVRHEQAATHMADGYARVFGKSGVVLVTSGPGATNAVTGIATAYMDSFPMVVICGQVASHNIGSDAFQEIDMMGISRPIVKHSVSVRKPEDIADAVKEAFYIAESGRKGPVVLDIPKDITSPFYTFPYRWNKEPCKLKSYQPTYNPNKKQIKKVEELLLNAKKPIVYAGGGVISSNASDLLYKFVKLLNFPITNTLMGLGIFPAKDKQFLGMLGMHGTYEANNAMHNSDLIVAIGVRFDDRITNDVNKFCPNAKIIHIDIDPAEIGKNIPVNIPIVGDVSKVLKILLESLSKYEKFNDLSSWWEQINKWKAKKSLSYIESNSKLLKPQRVIEEVYKITKGNAYITSDVGQHQMFVAQYYKFNKPNRWINSGGLGTMGFGFPSAMGIKLALPDEEVVCITSEGSILMNIQELSTCKQYDINLKIVCLNNYSLGMVRQWQDLNYEGRHAHSYMDTIPDFTKLTESFGFIGIKIKRPEDLVDGLKKAFSIKEKLVFIDIDIDPYEHVYPMQIAGGAINEMWLNKVK